MPAFSAQLEQTLHRALAEASKRQHEYANLEHLLSALTQDKDAANVLRACGVDIDELNAQITRYLDTELESLKVDGQIDATPTAGLQRVVQRAILHVQSSGRDEVSGVFSAAARHDTPGCGIVHLAWHCQSAWAKPEQAGERG
jgi:ATP-dependent Clp protease ATP-binding subunit ClpA